MRSVDDKYFILEMIFGTCVVIGNFLLTWLLIIFLVQWHITDCLLRYYKLPPEGVRTYALNGQEWS